MAMDMNVKFHVQRPATLAMLAHIHFPTHLRSSRQFAQLKYPDHQPATVWQCYIGWHIIIFITLNSIQTTLQWFY